MLRTLLNVEKLKIFNIDSSNLKKLQCKLSPERQRKPAENNFPGSTKFLIRRDFMPEKNHIKPVASLAQSMMHIKS